MPVEFITKSNLVKASHLVYIEPRWCGSRIYADCQQMLFSSDHHIAEAVTRRCSVKKVFLEFRKFTGKHLRQSLHFNKFAGRSFLIKLQASGLRLY